MRRITPFPIEPPLQIWRCPLGASYNDQSPSERLWSIAAAKVPQQSTSTAPNERIRDLAIRVSTGRGADIDVSDPVFDFVRSIKIYDIDWSQHYRSGSEYGDCVSRKGRVRIGTYGMQGDFSWADFSILDAPAWIGMGLRPIQSCPAAGTFRGVAVEWTDYFGGHDYEVIRY